VADDPATGWPLAPAASLPKGSCSQNAWQQTELEIEPPLIERDRAATDLIERRDNDKAILRRLLAS
jgi:hypothetical protein